VRSADAGQCGATVDPGTATATNNCATVNISGSRSDGKALTALYPIGTTTITWTAIDSNLRMATCMQTVTVTDDEAPQITCLKDVTVCTDSGQCTATVKLDTTTATDNCGSASVSGSRSDSQALTAPYPKGTTTVTWTAMDAAGHTAT